MWVCGLDWAGPGQRQVAEACECGNKNSGFVKCREFLDQLQTSQLLKKDSAPWSKQVSITTTYNINTLKLNVFNNLSFICIQQYKVRHLYENRVNLRHPFYQYLRGFIYTIYHFSISLFRSRLLSRATKIILYKTLIIPVVSYGAEAWNLTKKEEKNSTNF